MDSQPPEPSDGRWQYAGENLRRLKTSGVYYAFVKRHGKQISRSLETTDKPLAKRRLADFRRDLERLAPDEDSNLTFEQVAARWLETTRHTVKESSHDRRVRCVAALVPFLSGKSVKHVTAGDCDAWVTRRATKSARRISAQTFTHELNTLNAVFNYALEHGMILRNPAVHIKRPRIVSKKPNIPTREQFQNIVAVIRAEPRERGGADLIELLAYSGMRLNEATALRWRDVNFSRGEFTVTGGERGTKNHEQRTVPLFPQMLALLQRIKKERGKVAPDEFVIRIANARKSLTTVCRKLDFPHVHNHSLRHYFCTCAIESGTDIPTVAKWAGHKDGGALLMKRYAHLQQDHSKAQAQRVSFAPENQSLQQMPNRKPATRRGRKLAKLLEAGKSERGAAMTTAEVEQEIRERRGRKEMSLDEFYRLEFSDQAITDAVRESRDEH